MEKINPLAFLYILSCLSMFALIVSKRDEIIISLSVNKELKFFISSFKKEETAYSIIFMTYIILSPLFFFYLLINKE